MTTYVTVAIPYVNAAPHLGYAYELVAADIYARARRLSGEPVRFLGGTDDYSLKNVLAAEAASCDTATFVAGHAARFESLGGLLDVSFDDFIRTSADPRHRPAVERLWRACAASGDLYPRQYEGDYCVGCEQFYAAAELVDGCCPEHGTPAERVRERNWFFRLSRYQEHIERLLTSGELAVRPEPFRDEVVGFVRAGLQDISVSRSVTRARGWGIGVPGDDSQVVYVWFDALANYISALGFGGEPGGDYRTWWLDSDQRVHVIGKGILRFHAVFWPAFLASAGQPPPTAIHVHPYLTVDGAKLSKSTGAGPEPARVVDGVGADALRWWFARDVAELADTDFTFERLVTRANEELAGGLGNLVNRIVTLHHRHRGSSPAVRVPPIDPVAGLEPAVLAAAGAFDLRGATRLVVDAVRAVNRHLEAARPWALPAADPDLGGLLDAYLASARAIARAAAPIVPLLSARLVEQLGSEAGVPPPRPVYARIERPPGKVGRPLAWNLFLRAGRE